MKRLNEILHELGISKVKLAKYLGVSRQMIYNYLELDDINKWPKDKKVMLLNLLGVKSAEEIDSIKVDTDYIISVEARIESIFENSEKEAEFDHLFNGLNDKSKELLNNIVALIKDDLEDDDSNGRNYKTYEYLYSFLKTMASSPELKYTLVYMAKAAGFVKPMEFIYDDEDQLLFESILFSAMTLYKNPDNLSKSRLAESHKRFAEQIEHRIEEKMSRTLELNTLKLQALKELNYTKITDENANEVLQKIAEIESRKIS